MEENRVAGVDITFQRLHPIAVTLKDTGAPLTFRQHVGFDIGKWWRAVKAALIQYTKTQAAQYAEQTMKPDTQWCRERHKEFMPVVFPGFSWHNLKERAPLNHIPRLKGQFLWTQFMQAKKAGATMVYQAMFDEVNEGTAIFKCTDNPPVGASTFSTYEGLPSDFYLKLVGKASRMMRGEIPVTDAVPK